VGLDDVFDDEKPKPGSIHLCRALQATKFGKERRQVLFGNPDAGIADAGANVAVFLPGFY
jgi:hypothetical protein